MPRISLRLIAPAGLVAIVSVTAGCAPNLTDIDRKVDALLAERQHALQSQADPRRSFEATVTSPTGGSSYDETPGTQNPAAEALHTDVAEEMTEDQLTARLERYHEPPGMALSLDLQDCFRIAMTSGREYLSAQEEYLIAALRLLMERHRWGPRFFDDVAASASGSPSTAGYETALSIINTLRASQRLPHGGELEARALYQSTETLREAASNEYRQSAELVLSAQIPLLRGAGRIAREDLIQAERDLVYAARSFERFRRTYFVSIANDYFSLIAAQNAIENQSGQLVSLERQLTGTRMKFDMGRLAKPDVDNVERSVLSGRDRLISLKESYALALDRFKLRLNIPISQAIALQPVRFEMPSPSVSLEDATRAALRYRLDLQTETDWLDDHRRAVANAVNQLLPDLDVTASVTAPTDSDSNALDSFALDQMLYQAGVSFSLPLDREIERAALRQQTIRFAQAERNLAQRRDEIVLEARRAVRDIDRARLSTKLQERNIFITQRRLDLLHRREDTNPQSLLDAELDLVIAKDALANAVRDLRSNILGYLLATGQMRISAEGRFQPLGGMVIEPVEPVDEVGGYEPEASTDGLTQPDDE
ncbi:MAG: TolC family protein [Phycisphaerales bacterium]|nr:TolC family protein [Phycisphaerales bacterium]